jgi:4-amino-4-deoxy-L-arabinose transferase-like glycosyltransferase
MPKNLLRFTIGLMVFQMFLWTLVPMLAHHAPPLDATEMYSWSLSFQWGFYKHPPMPAWIVSIVQMLVGKNMFSLFLCASMAISASYYCVTWLANRFLSEKEATVAVFLYALTIYCNLWSTDFNHNQIQMPFWGLSLVCLVICLDTGSKKWALILGVVMGLNALSKYTAAFIMPSAMALLMLSPHWRKHFNLTQLCIASIAFLVVFLPHLYWLTQNDFMPFHYVNERFDEMKKTNRLLDLADYIGNILLAHLCLLLACLFLMRKKLIESNITKNDQIFIWILGVGPVLTTIVLGLFVPLYHRWAIPMLPMITIVFAMLLKGRFAYLYNKKAFIFYVVLQILFGLVYLNKDKINPNQSARGNYPAPELSQAIYEKWHALYPDQAFKIVSGGEWEAGVVSLFSPDKTYVYTQADSVITPWISEKNANDCGMVMLNPSASDLDRFPLAKIEASIEVRSSITNTKANINYAINPPQGKCLLK